MNWNGTRYPWLFLAALTGLLAFGTTWGCRQEKPKQPGDRTGSAPAAESTSDSSAKPQAGNSKHETARIQLATFVNALDIFHLKYNEFPDTATGLWSLVPDYLKSLPLDPWEQPYLYVCQDGRSYTLWSNGPDKLPQTTDDIPSK